MEVAKPKEKSRKPARAAVSELLSRVESLEVCEDELDETAEEEGGTSRNEAIEEEGPIAASPDLPQEAPSEMQENLEPVHSSVENVQSIVPPAVAAPATEEQQPSVKALYPEIAATAPEHQNETFKPLLLEQEKPKIEEMYLTEEQLRTFYVNPELDAADEFVEAFLQNELNPNRDDAFYRLVSEYLESCHLQEKAELEVKEALEREKVQLDSLWTLETRSLAESGKCGDSRPATGSATYQLASLDQQSLAALAKAMEDTRVSWTDRRLSAVQNCMCFSRQCQNCVRKCVEDFAVENGLSPQCPATALLGSGGACETAARLLLRHKLRVLFHFLRFPSLPETFLGSVKTWISELMGWLLRAATEVDQEYVLCQLLRSPISLDSWAVGFLQPLSATSANVQARVNHFMGLLSLLLSPIRMREEFLSNRILTDLDDDSVWTLVDEFGEEEPSRLVAVPEQDLLSLLNQFDFDAFFWLSLHSFTEEAVTEARLLYLVSFELTLLKVFSEGLHNYSRPNYNQFCKQLAYLFRRSVQYVSECWGSCQGQFPTAPESVSRLTAEFDRILLFSVVCLTATKHLGLWQFVVDLPYKIGSVQCLWRVVHILMNPTQTPLNCLWSLEPSTIAGSLQSGNHLESRVSELELKDGTFVLAALANVAAASSDPQLAQIVLHQILQVCFLNTDLRQLYCKVGRSCVAVIVEKQLAMYSVLLVFLDRNMEELGEYAMDVLGGSVLSDWRPDRKDLLLCSKWLLNSEPASPSSRVAELLFRKLHWGPGCDGHLFLHHSLHALVAQILIKAHLAHCKSQNALMATAWKKTSKLTSRVQPKEQKFSAFVWDVILQLKFPNDGEPVPFSDRTDCCVARYVRVMQEFLNEEERFLRQGLDDVESLLHAECFLPVASLLAAAVFANFRAPALSRDQRFLSCVDRIIHLDQTYPGQYLELLSSAIAVRASGLCRMCQK